VFNNQIALNLARSVVLPGSHRNARLAYLGLAFSRNPAQRTAIKDIFQMKIIFVLHAL